MPELPEVEAARILAARVAGGRRIVRVWCAPDPIVFEAVPSARIRRALVGRRVTGVGRHGKHFWLELDQRPWPCFHFGMAGGLHAPRARAVRLRSSGKRDAGAAWPPRFTKLRLTFDDGGELAMSDGRRLGRIRLRQDPRGEPPISRLGFDALLAVPPPARFFSLLTERAAPVKALLLDQSFAAGVGNWIADEVLYQARIAPRRRARSLSREEARRLRAALGSVITTAVAVGADSDRFPRAWLFHDRWGRDATATTARGEKIRHDTIGGRTTAWVPTVQR
jgi:formamidopyrimidine-DNA glycosylase